MNEGINCSMTKGGNSHINGAELAHLSWGFGLHPKKKKLKWRRAEERLIVYVLRAMAYSIYVLYVLIEA